jgi:hypothetical protein
MALLAAPFIALALFCPWVAAVLSLELYRQPGTDTVYGPHTKRSSILTVLEQNSELYFVNVSIGTPPQTMRLSVSPFVADTYVNTAANPVCSTAASACSNYSVYDPSSSSSYNFLSTGFHFNYVDGSGVSGDYATDTFSINGVTLNGLQFAVANRKASEPYGTLGLAYAVQEITVTVNGTQPYPNLPQALANKGAINSNAYSIWLDDRSSKSGNLLFGGVDTEKYTGELRSISIVPKQVSTANLSVPLTEIRFGDRVIFGGQNSTTTSASADFSTTLTYLPDDVTMVLYNVVNAKYSETTGAAIIDCAQAENTAVLSFTLSWPIVNVTMGELVIPFTNTDGKTACIFGVGPAGNTGIILGQTFLRSAYVVYNLANNELSIAQTKFNSKTTNVLEITNGVNGVPGAIRAPLSTSTRTSTINPTATNTGTARPTSLSTPRRLSGAAKAGIAVGVLAGAAAAALTIFLLWRRHKKSKAPQQPESAFVEDYAGKPELSAEGKQPNELEVPLRMELSGQSTYRNQVSELHGDVPVVGELGAQHEPGTGAR